ncbi:class I glutamine amidotransferase-like protein [Xylariaceae sp. FL0804]|nr:class I glutamine amidotransferase-like protein [Xylariaceae sp. FL0804]
MGTVQHPCSMALDASEPILCRPLRIAILLNSYNSRFLPAIQASYEGTIGAASPEARLTFFEPANRRGDFPNPACFDLIVFGGSNVDPRKSHPFIVEIHAFLRNLVDKWPQKKILGICWGHQTISRVFGGTLAESAHPEVGVATVDLTDRGREFFPSAAFRGSFRLQQHHRREVGVAAPGFYHLAQGNQCFLNTDNTILTFQGHPEKDSTTARLRMHDSLRWYGFDSLDEKAWTRLGRLMDMEHDGEMVWRRILQWVREPSAPTAMNKSCKM